MKIQIRVNPNSKKEKVERDDNGVYKISFNATREKGKANKKLVEILSEYFKVPKSQIQILNGFTARDKVVEILEE